MVDFGIARFMEQGSVDKLKNDSEITRPGMILGTARYMSPSRRVVCRSTDEATFSVSAS